ncbi:MAG: LysR family transcriptional regulator [Oligoflexia bacterium]|nr:LysR family transcriptional regulator [Oligoflexia bacterium]
MEFLNYHHLLYFYLVAREGSVSKASEILRLSQSTISTQIRTLEDQLRIKLFRRVGRKIAITEEAKNVYTYAEDIFKLGQELISVLHHHKSKGSVEVKVGFDHSLYKMAGYKLLSPLFHHKEIKLICYEDSCERLVLKLLSHDLDIIITNSPVAPQANIKVFNHLLGESPVAIYGHPKLLVDSKIKFPENLDKAPFLLPTNNTTLRRSLEEWFIARKVFPNIKAEIEDSALIKTFAREGIGFMASPTWAKSELKRSYNLVQVGLMTGIKELYYLISVQKKINNPIVLHLVEEHRSQLDNKDL